MEKAADMHIIFLNSLSMLYTNFFALQGNTSAIADAKNIETRI